jgi:Tol biopolymer transport system component
LPDVDPRSDFSGQGWAPDGRHLVFASNLGGNANFDIYTMNIDGSELVRIVEDSGGDFAPSWSPDGMQIAFQARRQNTTGWDIFVINADGTQERNITNSVVDEEVASWSPDGSQIVFQVKQAGGNSIYVMDADGQNRKLLVAGGTGSTHETPAWSPDGRRIAFASNLHLDTSVTYGASWSTSEIYTVNTDGSDIQRITFVSDDFHVARWPTWDPSGRTLAFELAEASKETRQILWHIATVNQDGSNYKRIQMARGGRLPRWAPR